MVTRADVVESAQSWLGTKFKHQGRGPEGMDCCGLVIRVANDLGLSDYDVKAYTRMGTGIDFVGQFDMNMTRKSPVPTPVSWPGVALPGDVLLFRDRRFTIHAAILVEIDPKPKIIHAYAKRREVAYDFPMDYRDEQGLLYDRVTRVYEFKGLEK